MSGVLISDLSDHFITFTNLCFKKPKKTIQSKNQSRSFSKENIELFKNSLDGLTWNTVYDHEGPLDAFNAFDETFMTLFNLYFPVKNVQPNKNFHKIQGFMTAGLLVSRRRKNELYKNFTASRNFNDLESYKMYRNRYNSLLRAAKKLYYEQQLEIHQRNPKKTWDILNESLNRDVSKGSHIDKIKINDTVFTKPQDISDKFNDFFCDVPRTIRSSIPRTTAKPEDYLTETGLNFNFSPVDESEVLELGMSIESKTSLDINGLNSKVLKEVLPSISSPLSYIFNRSLLTGLIPDKLKVARTCPIFKSDEREYLTNYRPISCLPVISKIMEKLVYKRLSKFLNENNLLYKHQYGFQSGKSTIHPLTNILNFITSAFNNNEIAVAVFLDYQKAFDLVDHNILLLKLRKLGIKGIPLLWFENYLKNRKQFVMANGTLSSFFRLLEFSVPQGSILGPLLFLIFINDMFLSNKLMNFLFADDTTGLHKGKSIQEIGTFINTELQKLGMWLRANNLSINTSKTKIMIFHPKGKQIEHFDFFFNNNDIDSVPDPTLIKPIERITNDSKIPAYKMLGVWLDENLTFNYHVKHVKNKISSVLFSMRKVKNILNPAALKTIYYALIHPHFLYCLPIYSCTSTKNIQLLFAKQKACVRIILNAKYNAHSQPLFHSLGILPLESLINHQIGMLMHSIYYDYSLIDYERFFVKNENHHHYALRNENEFNFFVPRVRTDFLRRFPIFKFATVWNEIETYIKSIQSKVLFKTNLKYFMLNELAGFSCNKLFCYTCSLNV
jgi:hypothetical protein